MRNIETFPSKQMYPYLSLVERKVAEFYLNIDRMRWLVWFLMTYFHHFFRTIHGVLVLCPCFTIFFRFFFHSLCCLLCCCFVSASLTYWAQQSCAGKSPFHLESRCPESRSCKETAKVKTAFRVAETLMKEMSRYKCSFFFCNCVRSVFTCQFMVSSSITLELKLSRWSVQYCLFTIHFNWFAIPSQH